MFYDKNLPIFERALRITGGIGLIISGMAYFHGSSGSLWGLSIAASGMGAVVTGFLGFCLACAMVGRKLNTREQGT